MTADLSEDPSKSKEVSRADRGHCNPGSCVKLRSQSASCTNARRRARLRPPQVPTQESHSLDRRTCPFRWHKLVKSGRAGCSGTMPLAQKSLAENPAMGAASRCALDARGGERTAPGDLACPASAASLLRREATSSAIFQPCAHE